MGEWPRTIYSFPQSRNFMEAPGTKGLQVTIRHSSMWQSNSAELCLLHVTHTVPGLDSCRLWGAATKLRRFDGRFQVVVGMASRGKLITLITIYCGFSLLAVCRSMFAMLVHDEN